MFLDQGVREQTDWQNARDICRNGENNADLPVVHDRLENSFLLDFAIRHEMDLWLGILEKNVSIYS
jgi:hypothetical protein